MILKKMREKEKRQMKFTAALKGINLDEEDEDPVQQRIEEVKRRAAIKLKGEQEVEREEFADIGIGFITE